MKINYIIKLKNGDMIEITDDQYKKISALLTSAKAPKFIIISDEVIAVDYIATIRPEAW